LQYIQKVYTFVLYNTAMKTLSLKLDDEIFEEAELITKEMNLPRNRYINEAVKIFNQYHKKRLLKMQLVKESNISSKDSMDVLKDFERFIDGN
jgi:antitoxin component of RelBE/YafQ-DinJ toxin-antitoxin module